MFQGEPNQYIWRGEFGRLSLEFRFTDATGLTGHAR